MVRLIALAILVPLTLYTAWTISIAEQSLLAFGLELISSPDTAQLVIDLYLMAGLAAFWMVRDNRLRGGTTKALIPYLLLTAVFVSVGPLLYLAVRGVAQGQRA